jgi:hypothetical protein
MMHNKIENNPLIAKKKTQKKKATTQSNFIHKLSNHQHNLKLIPNKQQWMKKTTHWKKESNMASLLGCTTKQRNII